MNINSIVEKIQNLLLENNTPAQVLPAILLRYTAAKRPGLSPQRIASKVISENSKLGINVNDNPDGSVNVVNEFTYNIVKQVVEALKNDASIQVTIPMQSLVIQATGANGGGPLTAVGTNLTDTVAQGIIV